MSSQSQIDANRRNAQRSTGPPTPEGKAKVANNGRPRSLSARNPVLSIENPAEFQPRIESGLTVHRMERARQVDHCPGAAPKPAHTIRQQRYDQETRLLGIAFYQDCEDNAFVKLLRYENALRRAYYKALKQLQSPQPARQAGPTERSQTPPGPDRGAAAPTPPAPCPIRESQTRFPERTHHGPQSQETTPLTPSKTNPPAPLQPPSSRGRLAPSSDAADARGYEAREGRRTEAYSTVRRGSRPSATK